MRRKREFFSLIVAGLLFISASPAFAISLLKVARDTLDTQLKATVPGYNESFYVYDESMGEGVIIVSVETEEDKAKIPDFYMGYPVRKRVQSKIVSVKEAGDAFHEEFKAVPGYNESSYAHYGEDMGEAITVYVETEEDKAKIPDFYMGYPVRKRVQSKVIDACVAIEREFHGKVAGFEATYSGRTIIVYIRNEEDKAKIPDFYMGYPVQVELKRGEKWVTVNFDEDYRDVPGFVRAEGPEEGVIVVYVETEEDKAKIPDSYEGYPIKKEVGGKEQGVGVIVDNLYGAYGAVGGEPHGRSGFYGLPFPTSGMSKAKSHLTNKPSIPFPTIMGRGMLIDGMYMGIDLIYVDGMLVGGSSAYYKDERGGDKIYISHLWNIINSRVDEFFMMKSRINELSMPEAFTIQPRSHFIGMSNNESLHVPQSSLPNLGTKPQLVPQFSLPQPSVAPMITLPNLGTKLQMETNNLNNYK